MKVPIKKHWNLKPGGETRRENRDTYDFMPFSEVMELDIEPLRLVCLWHDLPVRRLVRRSLDEDGPVRRSSNEDGSSEERRRVLLGDYSVFVLMISISTRRFMRLPSEVLLLAIKF